MNPPRCKLQPSNSLPAPVFDAIDLNMSIATIHGSHDSPSVFKGPPSAEIDAAWDHVTMDGREGYLVSAADLIRSGKDPLVNLKAPLSWGGGPDAYIVEINVFHYLHCLDTLRKHLHKEHYFDGAPDEKAVEHRDHCLDTLRQVLMCNADVGLVPVNWVWREASGEAVPKEDWNVNTMCRDFDALLRWGYENALPDFHHKWKNIEIQESDAIIGL